eukprot:s2817_g5.t1
MRSYLANGQDLKESRCRPIQILNSCLQKKGWAMSAMMALFSLASTEAPGWYPLLGPPREHAVWQPHASNWNFLDRERREPLGEGQNVHCYVYTKEDSFVNWLADSHGKKDTLDKTDNKFLREALTTTAYENGGAVSPLNFRDQARQLGWHVGKAMEMATGWNFATTGRHRGEALRLVAEHRPALLWLGHRPELAESELHLDFVVQLARIQLQAGRGFLVACPTREQPSGLRPLLEDPHVLQVLLAGSPQCSVLVTNVDSVVSAMHNRSLQATGSLPPPVAQPDFAEHILKGLRRHLQRQHFPVFGLSDRWEWSCGELVCRHFQPRREAVSPRQCQCFDLTNVKPAAEYADWLAKAAAHALFAHQSEEFAFQCEWTCWTAPPFSLHRYNFRKKEMKHWFERNFVIWEWDPFRIPAHVAVIQTLSILLQSFVVNFIDYIGTWVILT